MSRRLRTGCFQDEGDWPGYFIRGDDCMGLVAAIRQLERYFETHGLPEELQKPMGDLMDHRETIEREVLIHS